MPEANPHLLLIMDAMLGAFEEANATESADTTEAQQVASILAELAGDPDKLAQVLEGKGAE